MSNIDLVLMGMKNLFRRKARTILTVLGVVIGTASIIVMVSLGLGLNKGFEEQLESMGSLNQIDVSTGRDFGESDGTGETKLDDDAIANIENLAHVIVAMGRSNADGRIISGRYETYAGVYGVDLDKFQMFDVNLSWGTMPTKSGVSEVLFGYAVLDNFYDPKSRNPYENQLNIDIESAKFEFLPGWEMSGKKERGYVINPTALSTEDNWDYAWDIYMDEDELARIMKDYNRKNKNNDNSDRREEEDKYRDIKVLVDDIDNVAKVQEEIESMGFYAYSMNEMLDSMKETSALIQAVLGAIGAVSLLVAAIGITNTMVMSIYERTKEIGVMKVIGAQLKDIKKLFLFEAAMIGFMGGFIGLALSLIISIVLNKLAMNYGLLDYGQTTLSYIPIWLAFVGIGFSTLVGIVSGYYPAVKATKLSALEAIRTDG